MDATISLVTRLAVTAGRVGLTPLALGSLVLIGLALLAMAFVAGTLLAGLLATESEAVLAAPFRW